MGKRDASMVSTQERSACGHPSTSPNEFTPQSKPRTRSAISPERSLTGKNSLLLFIIRFRKNWPPPNKKNKTKTKKKLSTNKPPPWPSFFFFFFFPPGMLSTPKKTPQ